MANFNGVVYAVYQTPSSPATWLTAGYVNGREKLNIDYYVGLGTEASGSVLYMGNPLPAGAKVLAIDLTSSANTAALTTSVGDLSSATRYASAATDMQTLRRATYNGMIDATNGGYVVGTNPGTGASASTTGDAQIIITTGGATLIAGVIYGCIVHFVTD